MLFRILVIFFYTCCDSACISIVVFSTRLYGFYICKQWMLEFLHFCEGDRSLEAFPSVKLTSDVTVSAPCISGSFLECKLKLLFSHLLSAHRMTLVISSASPYTSNTAPRPV